MARVVGINCVLHRADKTRCGGFEVRGVLREIDSQNRIQCRVVRGERGPGERDDIAVGRGGRERRALRHHRAMPR